MSRKYTSPSRWYYGFSFMLFFVGIAIAITIILYNFNRFHDKPQQFLIPGDGEILFSRTGPYTLYYEYRSIYQDEIFQTPKSFIEVEPTLISIKNNDEVLFLPARLTFRRYIFGDDRDAIALYNFNITKTGNYYFSAQLSETQLEQEVILSIAPNFISIGARALIVSTLIFILTSVASIILALLIYFKRRESLLKELFERKILFPYPRSVMKQHHPLN